MVRQAADRQAHHKGNINMNKLIIVKLIAGFTFLTGVAVMLGWYFDIGILKSILPVWVTMKFTTALCFSLSGVTLFFMVRIIEGELDLSRLMLSLAAFTVLLIMLILLFSSLLKIRTGMEDFFIKESSAVISMTIPGQPSMGTIVNFILIAVGGLLVILNPQRRKKLLLTLGWVITLVALTAIVGYIINVPSLYYAFEDISNAMALHTSILFILFGFGFILLAKDQ